MQMLRLIYGSFVFMGPYEQIKSKQSKAKQISARMGPYEQIKAKQSKAKQNTVPASPKRIQ